MVSAFWGRYLFPSCWIVLSEAVCPSTSISGPLYSNHIVENICSLLPFKVRFGPCDLTSQWHGHRCQASFLGRSPKGQSSATCSLSLFISLPQQWAGPAVTTCSLGAQGKDKHGELPADPWRMQCEWDVDLVLEALRFGGCLLLQHNPDIRFWQMKCGAEQLSSLPGWLWRNHGEGFLLYLPKSPQCPLAIYLLLSKLLAILWPLIKKPKFNSWSFVVAAIDFVFIFEAEASVKEEKALDGEVAVLLYWLCR